MKKLIIAMDIDGCWSEDPRCFLAAHNLFKSFGHEVIIVTGREQPMDKLERLKIPPSTKIIVSGDRPKRRALADHGYTGSIIFVDDMPEMCGDTKILGGELE